MGDIQGRIKLANNGRHSKSRHRHSRTMGDIGNRINTTQEQCKTFKIASTPLRNNAKHLKSHQHYSGTMEIFEFASVLFGKYGRHHESHQHHSGTMKNNRNRTGTTQEQGDTCKTTSASLGNNGIHSKLHEYHSRTMGDIRNPINATRKQWETFRKYIFKRNRSNVTSMHRFMLSRIPIFLFFYIVS